MEQKNKALAAAGDMDWRSRVYLLGGVVGIILGLISAHFYVKAADETGGQPETPSSRETVRLGLTLLGIIRTITEWGSRR